METTAAVTTPRQARRRDSRQRRVFVIWGLLFFNVLSPGQGTLLVPHRIAQVLAQGALFIALVLAVSLNPRMRLRPNWLLGLYSLLAITSLMMSVRLVGVGTTYRGLRMFVFLFVLWLLTPWWGRRDLLILRSHLRFLLILLGSVVLGLCISPGKAMANGRLGGTLWAITPTAVAHFAGELAGLTALLWLCRLVSGRRALLVVVPAIIVLLLTHTRTALVATIAGLLVAGVSLLLTRSRVRKAFAVSLLLAVAIAVLAAPFVVQWSTRGENTQGLQTLTGRTKAWSAVLAVHRPTTNVIFGNGLSNDGVVGSTKGLNGLPIDSSWLSAYQNQGIVGVLLVGAILLLLLLTAISRARGPTRALALFLIVYCIIAGITESGLGDASPYLLDLAVVGSLIAFPSAIGNDLTLGPSLSEHPQSLEIER